MSGGDVPGVAAAVEKLVMTEASEKETVAVPQEEKVSACVVLNRILSAFRRRPGNRKRAS